MSDTGDTRRDIRYIRYLYRIAKRPVDRITKWAKQRNRIRRFSSATKWARQMQEHADTRKSALKWKAVRFRWKTKVDYLIKLREGGGEANATNFEPWMTNGHPGNISTGVKAAIARGVSHGLYTTSTTDGRSHTITSNHYSWNHADNLGHAVDMGGTYANMVAFQRSEANRGDDLRELIGPDNTLTYSGGSRYTTGEGSALESAHDNHVHRATYG
jgi:hypothetical protein